MEKTKEKVVRSAANAGFHRAIGDVLFSLACACCFTDDENLRSALISAQSSIVKACQDFGYGK